MSERPDPEGSSGMRGLLYVLSLAMVVPACGQKLTAEPVPNPSAKGSLQPNWSTAQDGSAILSWIEPSKDGSYSLRYAVRKWTAWSEARTVAAHRHVFRHPAEIPEVIQAGDKLWLAHWVEMPQESSEAEYIYVASSTDGTHWSAPQMAHRDRLAVEHGLVSMTGGADGASLFWLETPKGEDGPAYLMRTVVDASGKELKEERLDSDVCSCCPTAVTRTAHGLLVAYRDHTPADIRDIAVLRFENEKWTPSKIVHADNWRLNACPVNAAAVAAKGNHVALSWFTEAQGAAKIQLVFSEDSGSTFSKPAVVSTGHAVGYTSVALDDDGGAIVSWLERKDAGSVRILVRKVTAAGAPGPVVEVAAGGKQALGYPRLVHGAGGTFIAWGGAGVQVARLSK